MAQAGGEPSGGIVTDGLVFRLNGLNQGGVDGHWIDEIGGHIFTLTQCENLENGVKFLDSVESFADCPDKIPFPVTGSFELCGNFTADVGRIFTPHRDAADAQFLINQYGRTLIIGDSVTRLSMPVFDFREKWATFSTVATSSWANTEKLAISGADWYTNKNRATTIGNARSGVRGFSGIIHEIRYYNRKLTEAEILQNQQYDIDTYFGGVTP